MAHLPLVPGTLAQDCYPASAQALYDAMFQKGYAVGGEIVGVLIQDNPPDDHDQGWIPTASDIPLYPGYVFVWHATLGHWVSRNPIAANDDSRRIFVGLSTDVDTYDGGEAGAATPAGGKMWEIDTAFAGSVPIGVGLIPGSSPAASIAAPLATADTLGASGEYKHVLTGPEGSVADHVHPVGKFNSAGGDDAFFNQTGTQTIPAYSGKYITGSGPTIVDTLTVADIYTLKAADGAGVTAVGHNNLQPFIGVFFIKRTARQFYRLG